MDNLEDSRKKIDALDTQMAALFEERMEVCRQIAAYKAAHGLVVSDPSREEEVLRRGAAHIKDNDIREYYVPFQKEVMALSRDWQRRLSSGLKVAYSGVPGAFAYIAAQRLFPGAELVSYPDFVQAYKACEAEEADVAVLPFENSSAGEVSSVTDLMFSGSLYVNQVIEVEADQYLLGLPGADKAQVRRHSLNAPNTSSATISSAAKCRTPPSPRSGWPRSRTLIVPRSGRPRLLNYMACRCSSRGSTPTVRTLPASPRSPGCSGWIRKTSARWASTSS